MGQETNCDLMEDKAGSQCTERAPQNARERP